MVSLGEAVAAWHQQVTELARKIMEAKVIIPLQIEADLALLASASDFEGDGDEFRFVTSRHELVEAGKRIEEAIHQLLDLMEETAEPTPRAEAPNTGE